MNIKDLIGKSYPVCGETDEFVATRTIKEVAEVENYAGILISTLPQMDPRHYVLIPYSKAQEILDGKYDYLPKI